MIQRISELDKYYTLSNANSSVPNFQDDFLSVNEKRELVPDKNKWPALSSCILFEVSRAPNDGNGNMIQPNDVVSYYKSYKVGGDLIALLCRASVVEYFKENPFDLGERGDDDTCHGDPQGHKRYPDEDEEKVINAYAKMEFHAQLTSHNKVEFHDDVHMHGPVFNFSQVSSIIGPSLTVQNGVWSFAKDIDGTCMRARWADLAECYKSDADYPPGTLVEFGGEEEITVARFQANAIVTSKPGFVLNSEMKSSDDSCRVLGITLTGRTPVRVIGPVKKFDRLCISDTPGVACKKENMPLRNTIGVALESNDGSGEKLVMSTVQLNLG